MLYVGMGWDWTMDGNHRLRAPLKYHIFWMWCGCESIAKKLRLRQPNRKI